MHGPSLSSDNGLSRGDRMACEVHSTVDETWNYCPEERIGQAVDTYEDRPPEDLTQREKKKMRIHGQLNVREWQT